MKRGYTRSLVLELKNGISKELVEYFDTTKKTNKMFPSDLITVVDEVVTEELNEETNTSELKKIYRTKKKNLLTKKKRYYENCKRMVESQSWKTDDIERYCFKDVAYNNKFFNEEQWNAAYNNKTFEAVQAEELEKIKKWAEDSSSKMIEYGGREKRTPKSIYTNFKQDVTLDVLRILEEHYQFNIEDLIFAVMDDLSDKSVFGNKREKISRDDADEGGHLIVFGDETGNRRTQITFSKDLFDENDTVKGFDVKDQEILSTLLQIAEKYEGTEYPIYVEVATVAHAIYKGRKLSKRDYDEVVKRVRKLTANIDYYENNVWKKTLHLLDYAEREMQSGRDYIAFTPSLYTNNEIENKRVVKLPARERNSLTNGAAKLLYHTFLTQRVKAYKKCKQNNLQNEPFIVNYQYAHFMRFVNFGGGNKKNNHEEIMRALEDYKSKGIFINGYTYDKNKKTYAIEFLPLTPEEIQDLEYYLGEEIDVKEDMIQLTIFDFED